MYGIIERKEKSRRRRVAYLHFAAGGGEEATKMWAIASVLLEGLHLRTELVAATAARYQVDLLAL